LNKKGIIISVLVVELIFLLLISFEELRSSRNIFIDDNSVRNIAAYKLSSIFNDIYSDYSSLIAYDSDNYTKDYYFNFINLNFKNYSEYNLNFLPQNLTISDDYFEMKKFKTFPQN